MDKNQVILGALYVARDQYKKDAESSRHTTFLEGWERVAKQFEKQAKDCETLIEEYENA